MSASTFRIVTVCTGNVCRSPLAEAHLDDFFRRMRGVTVTSAGTRPSDGMAPPAQTLAQAESLGLDLSEHRARLLTAGDVQTADLVLGLAREHRRGAVVLRPRASRRSFTLREFARLALTLTDADFAEIAGLTLDDRHGRLTAAVDLVASRRGLVPMPSSPEDDDVVDPMGHPDSVFSRATKQIVPASEVVVRLLAHAATVVTP